MEPDAIEATDPVKERNDAMGHASSLFPRFMIDGVGSPSKAESRFNGQTGFPLLRQSV